MTTIVIFGRAKNTERKIKKSSKEIIAEMKQKRLSLITLQGAIEKSSILLSRKKIILDSTINNLQFGAPIIFLSTVWWRHLTVGLYMIV